MLTELVSQLRKYDMVHPGDSVVCAVSGGADSMALLMAMYVLKEKLGISLSAAHFNHRLRGEESDRDEAFVRDFCDRLDIPLFVGSGAVSAGPKGLEAAAREARYAFFANLDGKVATAHTADDNAETVLMHLVRGTGLKGLGGIMPVNGKYIRPMLNVTRVQAEAFLEEYHVSYVEDSSNAGDDFLRNRLRHHVMPLLKQENPKLSENMSAMAQRLRLDEAALADMAQYDALPPVTQMRELAPAVRSRMLERFLKENGVKEPESAHIQMAESLVFSDNPSAAAHLPGNVMVRRSYDRLEAVAEPVPLETVVLPENGEVQIPGMRIVCKPAETIVNSGMVFTVCPKGQMIVRCRQSGDEICLSGGTKSLKKLFIDRKIPAHERSQIPVIADSEGVLGVYGIGADHSRRAMELPAVQIEFINSSEKL
jgi:tRNA(Ile)-lysidine synthase